MLTGSWDNSVRLWDPRKPGAEAVKLVAPGKVYSMSLAAEAGTIVVACADRKVATFDLRGAGAGGGAGGALAGAAAKVRDTTLKHQLRCVRVMPDDEAGFIAGSIEGRCAVDFFSPDSGSAKPYTFKCHRVADPAAGAGEERIHPVNAIAFHPTFGTFATGESRAGRQQAGRQAGGQACAVLALLYMRPLRMRAACSRTASITMALLPLPPPQWPLSLLRRPFPLPFLIIIRHPLPSPPSRPCPCPLQAAATARC